MTLRIGWFSTGNGPGSRNLLNAVMDEVRAGTLDVEIPVVFCNREYGERDGSDRFIELVRSHGLDLITYSSAAFRREHDGALSRPGEPLPSWRETYDAAVAEKLAPYDLGYGMLAGYMLICTAALCQRFSLLNLHPAAPGGPTGTWQEVIHQLIRTQAPASGAMVHLATPELDEGPPVAYCSFSLRGYPIDAYWAAERGEPSPDREMLERSALFREIRRQGAARELPLVVETLRALAGGRIAVEGGRVLDAGGRETPPLNLSREVDSLVVPMLSNELASPE